jgi:AAA15 family ATPase/GTPase
MINSVDIDGYRGFKNYKVHELGRVNLLVGKNNSGKTSVLEALYLLSSGGDPYAIWQICSRRGEQINFEERTSRFGRNMEVDVSHLFNGHELYIGQKFSISKKDEKKESYINVIGSCSTWYRPHDSIDRAFDGGVGMNAVPCGGADDGSDIGEELRTPA